MVTILKPNTSIIGLFCKNRKKARIIIVIPEIAIFMLFIAIFMQPSNTDNTF